MAPRTTAGHNAGMTLTELKYIVAVAREKHFGRAAEACFVSQPTLSTQLKKLEEELGVPLFERAPRNVEACEHRHTGEPREQGYGRQPAHAASAWIRRHEPHAHPCGQRGGPEARQEVVAVAARDHHPHHEVGDAAHGDDTRAAVAICGRTWAPSAPAH